VEAALGNREGLCGTYLVRWQSCKLSNCQKTPLMWVPNPCGPERKRGAYGCHYLSSLRNQRRLYHILPIMRGCDVILANSEGDDFIRQQVSG
jgi:hypothetical protein